MGLEHTLEMGKHRVFPNLTVKRNMRFEYVAVRRIHFECFFGRWYRILEKIYGRPYIMLLICGGTR